MNKLYIIINTLIKNSTEYLSVISLSIYIYILGLNASINYLYRETSFDTLLLLTMMGFLILISIPRIIKRMLFIHYIFIVIVCCVFLISSLINDLDLKICIRFFCFVFPMFFIGVSIDNLESLGNKMYKCSILATIAAILLILFTMKDRGYIHYMVPAYAFLPACVIQICMAIIKKKIFTILISIISFSILFIFAVRGPIICCMLSVILFLIYTVKKRILWLSLLFIVFLVLYMILDMFYYSLIDYFSNFFSSYGVINSIILRAIDDTLFESNGRNIIVNDLLSKINEHWLFGTGIYSDRSFVGTYSHNLIIEFWVDFGVLIGSFLVIMYFIKTITLFNIFKFDNITIAMLCSIISSSIFMLFFSGSYLESQSFFLFIGMLMNPNIYNKEI